MGTIKSIFLRNPDKTSQIVARRTSSFTPLDVLNPIQANEPTRDAEEDNQEDILAINQVIDSLFSDDPSNSPLEVEDPLSTNNIPTTPITQDHSPSPPPLPNPKPLPNPEPPFSTPPDTHRAASSTQEAQPEIPPTNEDQQLENQPHGDQPITKP